MRSCRLLAALLASSLLSWAPSAAAQGKAEPAVPEKAGKELHAFHITGTPPLIDGRADDEVWRLAPSIDDMVQNEPDNMKAPTERTVVQVAYDDKNVYVLARCFMRDPSQIVTGLGRRDSIPPSDLVRITFDPRHDHLTGYTFDTNPSSIQSDYTWYDDTRQNGDYDAVWSVRSAITSEGWNAEYQIPFSQMRFTVPQSGPMVWGFTVRRDLYRRGEYDRWVPTPRGAQGFISRLGHLVFDEMASPPRRLELLPYTTAGVLTKPGLHDTNFSGGLDVRRGLGTAATLSVTVNPDFAQVELDPAVLNLTVFETFFPEKRPFFLEDSRTFVLNYGQFPMFHSRRIGQAPGKLPLLPGDKLLSKPDQTTILGAAKLTGKSSGWTYGALTSLTSREYAVVETTTTDDSGGIVTGRADRLIEPASTYSVGRVQRDILGGSSNIGLLGTSVIREKMADAFTGGFDYNLRWDRNHYQFDGHWVATHAPFGDDVRTGGGGVSRFNYFSKHFSPYGNVDHFSKDFKNTDLGFISGRTNKSRVAGGFNLDQPDPWKKFRSLNMFSETGRQWTGEDIVFDKYVLVGWNASLKTYWSFGGNTFHNFERLDDLDTRGGPPIIKPSNNSYFFYINSDSRKRWQASGNWSALKDAEGGWSMSFGPQLRFQPSPRLQASVSTNYTHAQDVAQWITNLDTTGDGVIDYVYGHLERDVLSLTGRTAFSFDRNLTLEVYLQPFVAVGDYSDIRRLAAPSSFIFEPTTIPYNPDFNSKSLRGNVVLRWEYRPGSTFYVVWNMSTQDPSRPGVFSPWQDLGSTFTADGTHVFMIKLNYWLGL